MDFDIRGPIGLLFLIIGGLLAAYGALTPSQSLGLNINLIWGAAMALFGAAFLLLSLTAKRK